MPTRLVLLLLLVVVAAGGLVAVLLTRGSDATTSPYTGSLPPAGIRLPEFSLADQTGQPVGSSDLDGQVVLVTFLDTQCQDACPIVASVVGEGLRRLEPGERERVTAIAISVDPPEDTPESVAAFLERHKVTELLRYLVAPIEAIRPVWDDFAVASSFDSRDDNLHSVPVRIFDRTGTWVSTLNAGVDLTPENVAHDLRAALQSASD